MISGRRVLFFFILLLFFSAPAYSQDIYWERPVTLVEENGRFHRTAYGGGKTVVVWHEFISSGEQRGIVYLSMATSLDGENWVRSERFAGPFNYTGNEVPVCSLAVKDNGDVFVAVSADETTIKLFSTRDNGSRFSEITQKITFTMTVGPRLFIKEDNTLIMFVTREAENNLSIFYSLSENGTEWDDFIPLVTEPGLELNFLPHFVSKDGVEYAVFQAFIIQRRSTYQLYLKKSTDGGVTWDAAQHLTDMPEELSGTLIESTLFDNQRPFFKVDRGTIKLVWERRYVNDANPQIYYAEFDNSGILSLEIERLSQPNRACNFPMIAGYRGRDYITWFDNRMGDYSVIAASYTGIFWQDRDISRMTGNSIFGRPVEAGPDLYVFWENQRDGSSSIVFLAPDTSVDKPVVRARNFVPGRLSSNDRYSFSWNVPDDISGIAGFSYSVGRSSMGNAPQRVMNTIRQLETEVSITEDGQWYFYLSASDYAGNWSETVRIPVIRDTVPPGKITFNEFDTDTGGFLSSNTFAADWIPPPDEKLQGYNYNLQLISSNLRADMEQVSSRAGIRQPDGRNFTIQPELRFSNIDNGIWALTVSAVDEAGNTGEPETVFFKLDKYVPVTFITSIDPVIDQLERVNITITGRGFSVGGQIETIILDADGAEPWDYSFYLSDNAYRVETDRRITDFSVSDIAEGEYRIGLVHPRRGLYFTRPVINFEPSGTVKFGMFVSDSKTVWQPVRRKLFSINTGTMFLWLVIALLSVAVLFSINRIRVVAAEGRALEKDVSAVLRGVPMTPSEKKQRIVKMKRKGFGLRIKFTFFVIFIVLAVVLMVALPLGSFMLETQKANLVTGLRQQAEVMLESLTSGARSYLPASNTLELGLLPGQRSAMKDAVYVTITGKSSRDEDGYDYVWATDDTEIYSKISDSVLIPGASTINDAVSGMISDIEQQINESAAERVGGLAEEVEKLSAEARALIGRGGTPEALRDLQNQIREYDQQIQLILAEIGSEIRIMPALDTESGLIEDRTYLFYKPVIYRIPGEDIYYRGMVRLGVSTSDILAEIDRSNDFLIKQTLLIAAIAIIFGAVGALILAAIIIRPINRLLRGVELIRDTEDKESLKDHLIDVRTRDELYNLAETVNQMTQGLAKAAAASKDLTVGKEIQKMFIPLDKDSLGNKMTTGKDDKERFEFFGYYEGAKGVSGDYFDYIRLDENNYAMIKCDVAGKGVPASLIMVEVATIFLNYFRHWIPGSKINLPELIININDLLEERGFSGRFAALVLAVMNIKTGDCYLCNAGDKIVHLASSSEKKIKQFLLPETPATGVFPSGMVGDKFQQIKIKIGSGDSLMLFTDGVEESKRTFRNENFEPVLCNEPGLKEGEQHETHSFSSGDEELGLNRIYDIVNAVLNKSSYRLVKYHNPFGDEQLTFDFSSCEGTMEEVIMAMVSVERIFRVYPDPSAGGNDKIVVDSKVDAFLSSHFDQYRRYFSNRIENPQGKDYVMFTHLKQDDQYDDLTIMAFRRK